MSSTLKAKCGYRTAALRQRSDEAKGGLAPSFIAERPTGRGVASFGRSDRFQGQEFVHALAAADEADFGTVDENLGR
jgi:hypothetical protein